MLEKYLKLEPAHHVFFNTEQLVKMKLFKFFILSTVVFFAMSCTEEQVDESVYLEAVSDTEFLHRSVKKLTDVIVHNTFSPPVASRIYAYPSIAAYEVLRQDSPNQYKSLNGQLREFTGIPEPSDDKICQPMAAVYAYLNTGRQLIFTEDSILAFQSLLDEEYAALGVPKSVINSSRAYGQAVAEAIIGWSKNDQYAETRTLPKYDILVADSKKGDWIPTPPDRMDGIEPHWNKIRPFVIQAPDQFKPAPPTEFSTDKNSQFYKECLVVYKEGKKYSDIEKENLSDEQKEKISIAEFWDCNPYVSHHGGHAMYATKKITPGGHWVNITALVSRKAKASLMETSEAYALTCIALADAFISCWDEKYRSNLIRPETFINQFIDNNDTWQPLLQTPPFPEYTSGHSVISSAASVTLTSIYGDDFAFDDTSENEYGLPTRSFKSFYDASAEAAISRLYGGIHYMPAINNGVSQGKNVGKYIVENITLSVEREGITMNIE